MASTAMRIQPSFPTRDTEAELYGRGFFHPKRGGLDVDQLLPFVVPAAGADAMGRFGLVAVRTLGERGCGERVVSAPLVAAGLAVAALGVGHGLVTILSSGAGALSSADRRPRRRSGIPTRSDRPRSEGRGRGN